MQSHTAIPFREALRVWIRVALLSFGGPAGQIAVMHRILVDEKKWVSEERFLHALNYCMLLPGPEAMQLATYIGWLLHRTAGGLAAGCLFVAPGFLSILALSVVYANYKEAPAVDAVFFGLKAAVVAIVAHAVWRIGRRALRSGPLVALAAAAFAAIFLFNVPFPLIILGAIVIGLVGGRIRPDMFRPAPAPDAEGLTPSTESQPEGSGDAGADGAAAQPSAASAVRRALLTLALWLVIWLTPTLALLAILGRGHVFVEEALFFSKMAVVTFGGAYAVLSYVAQQAVEVYGWLAPLEMLDGLGMAETTPGPLIQVVQFVGYMGAWRDPGGLHPLAAGALASVLVTWVTFAPCFMFIFVGAPWVERLRESRVLASALAGITAAVVGVILNLAVWFALHTIFEDVDEVRIGPLRLLTPDPASVDLAALALTAGAIVAMFRFKLGMVWTLAACVAIGIPLRLLTGS
ncbi:MAG: chromate efflux transporter [Phycisphaeraceae bacterium]|nr:MAG: chromate efflux transporter [Phycisphaeraceae bacterium]